MFITVADNKSMEVVKRAFFLAWEEIKEGFNFKADEEKLWKEYVKLGHHHSPKTHKGKPISEYAYCALIVCGMYFSERGITIANKKPNVNHQVWARKYNTFEALAVAAATQIGAIIKIMEDTR